MLIHCFIATCLLSVLLISCKDNSSTDCGCKLNYSNTTNWASLPTTAYKKVDVFYVYPTLFGGTGVMNMDINDEKMRQRVRAVMPKQCGVFYKDCNVYVPYYRQVAMEGLSMEKHELDKYLSTANNDIEQAFDYYLTHINKGRPFILAGHSQGSQVLLNLMKRKFADTKLMNQLVAAYLIGYSVTDQDLTNFKWLKLAHSADDTGVIITYNAQSSNATGSPVLLKNAQCTNPLNWTTTSELATKDLHLGAVMFKQNGDIDTVIPHFTSAYIDKKGALVTDEPSIDDYSTLGFPKGVYHKYDYAFFFKNLEQNVGVRINTFLNSTK